MKEHDLIELSTLIVSEMYDHNMVRALNYIDDDVMCIGQFENMIFRGKEELTKKMAMEPKTLKFTLSTIISHTHRTSTKTIDVVLAFKVYYTNESTTMTEMNQIVHITWADRILSLNGTSQKKPLVVSIHVSNVSKLEKDDLEPSLNNPFISPPEILMSRTETGERIQVTGLDRATYFFLPATVKWIESCDAGQHSCIHLIDRDVVCINNISSLATKYEHIFVRTHESYLVNPGFVTSIRRFSISLIGGIELPVPERKYTTVKKILQNFFK